MTYSDRKHRRSKISTESPKQLNEDSMIARMRGLQTTDTDMRFDLFANEDKYIDPNNIVYHDKSYDNQPNYSYDDHDRDNEYSNRMDDYIKKDDSEESSHYHDSHRKKYESEREFETKEEEIHAKLTMLKKLGELTMKGVRLSQNYNMNSDYKTMAYEHELHTGMRKKTNTIRWMSNLMLNLCWGVEMANEHFDPFGFKLKDWSDQVKEDIDEYNDVFDELHEKWFKDGNEIAPELKLMFMLSGSAVKYHIAQSTLSSMPNLMEGLTANPKAAEKLQALYQKQKESNNNMQQQRENEIMQKMRDMEMLKQKQQEYQQQQYQPTFQQPQYQPPNFSSALDENTLMNELMSQKMRMQDLENQLRNQRSDTRSMNSAPKLKLPTMPASLKQKYNKKENYDNESTDSSVKYNPNLDNILRKSINDNKSIISQMSSIDNDLISGDTGSMPTKTGTKRRGRKPKVLKVET